MSYLVLARKWRPQHFDDVVGQRAVVRTLQNALAQDRVAHAMIFSGVRGVGKTTLARIMAKSINCRSHDSRPCNSCDSCIEFNRGGVLDLQEIDGASNRGIQEIRELKENIRFLPTSSRYKIIIIDEVHMLTTEAFNALLKTLEEPPEHVYFMFATTEMHKVPVTILSRCQRYELKRIPFQELLDFFQKVAAAEGVDMSPKSLAMITREAGGSVRDGLSLLDQIFAYGGMTVTDQDVADVLGLVDHQIIEELAVQLLGQNFSEALELLEHSYNNGVNLKRFASDLLLYFRALLVCKTSKEPAELLEVSDNDLERMRETVEEHNTATLYHCLHLLMRGVETMQYASNPRLALELTFAAIVQAGEMIPVSDLLARLAEIDPVKNMGRPAANIEKKNTGHDDLLSLPPKTINIPATGQNGTEKKPSQSLPSKSTGLQESRVISSTDGEFESRTSKRDVRRDWDTFIEYVMDRKRWMAHALRLCSGVVEEAGGLIVKYDTLSDCKVLQEKDNLKFLTEFAQDFFQKELSVQFRIKGNNKKDGSEESNEKPQEERRALANDPLVQTATEIFGGQITSIRTGPRSR